MRNAEIAQLVEHQLPKLRAAGSSPVFRSKLQQDEASQCDVFFCTRTSGRFTSPDGRV